MARTEFKQSVRQDAWDRCKGFCEKCTAKLFPGKFAYDHIIPDGLGGEATLENCQVLCTSCHNTKTVEEDRPPIQKADNIRKKHLGIKAKAPWWKPPGYKHTWGKRND
jgi:5-methylcytosine-specific restriction protein A